MKSCKYSTYFIFLFLFSQYQITLLGGTGLKAWIWSKISSQVTQVLFFPRIALEQMFAHHSSSTRPVLQSALGQGHSETWMFHTINPRPLIRSFVERSNNDDNSSEKYKTQTMIRFRELWSDPGGGWGQKATSFIPKTLSEGGRIRIWPTPIRARPRSHLKRWLPSAMPATSVCFSDLGKPWKLNAGNVISCWND